MDLPSPHASWLGDLELVLAPLCGNSPNLSTRPGHRGQAGEEPTSRYQKLTDTMVGLSIPHCDSWQQTITLNTTEWQSTPQCNCQHKTVTVNTTEWLSTPQSDCQHHRVTINTTVWQSTPHFKGDWQNTTEWLSTPQYDCQHKSVTVNTTMWKSTPHNDCQHLSVTYNTPLWLLPPHCDCDWQNTVWLSTAVRSTIMIPTATGPSPFMVCLLSDSFLKLHIQGPGDLLWWTYSHWLPRQEHQVAAAFCIKVPWTCLMKWNQCWNVYADLYQIACELNKKQKTK